MTHPIDMNAYGLTEHIQATASTITDLEIARILSQEKGYYRIVTEKGEKLAEISGKYRFQAVTMTDYPAVGDFVLVNWNVSGDTAIIEELLPRKSAFIRKAAGTTQQEQIVAANIDTVFLCMALNNDFNLRRLERYIATAWESGAIPVVVLTKSDLATDLQQTLTAVSSVAVGVDILVTTAMEEDSVQSLLPFLTQGQTVAFIGSSGVGKSTLINFLLEQAQQQTNGLRNDDKGRHTTTHRELFLIPSGGMVIDTPGMRELGMWENTSGIEQAFSDIEALTDTCKFRNCTHTNEPGCAILKALADGSLQEERWQSYQKLTLENNFAEDKEGYLLAKGKREKTISKQIKKMTIRR